jgi:histidyl-tRNA synthetase
MFARTKPGSATSDDSPMPRPTPLSGFPEWLPRQRIAEQLVLDTLRTAFELHGFVPVQTRAVEPLEQLLSKGETSKEVYVLRRLQAEEGSGDAGLGLHFDLTVPFARYVLENAGKLTFPFRRYQIQPAWRGERPQEGRFREFWQADIDIVGDGELATHHDAEILLAVLDALSRLPLPPVRIRVNNRRLVQGVCQFLGITDIEQTLRTLDKLDKIGVVGVRAVLVETAGCSAGAADALLGFAAVSGDAGAVRAAVAEVGAGGELVETGLAELVAVLDATVGTGAVIADLAITRGLDYYTGTVYETQLVGHEQLGSICSGGRYEALAQADGHTYPGVGISIGVSRLLSRLFAGGLLDASRAATAAVLVALPDEQSRAACSAIAGALRARGIPVEVSASASRYGKQIRDSDRRGIPFVWFPGAPGESDQVRDIRSGDQVPADATSWSPPAEDLHPRLVGGT